VPACTIPLLRDMYRKVMVVGPSVRTFLASGLGRHWETGWVTWEQARPLGLSSTQLRCHPTPQRHGACSRYMASRLLRSLQVPSPPAHPFSARPLQLYIEEPTHWRQLFPCLVWFVRGLLGQFRLKCGLAHVLNGSIQLTLLAHKFRSGVYSPLQGWTPYCPVTLSSA
jgi:hypothetical protein